MMALETNVLPRYLVREHARQAECDAVATFDKMRLKEPGFRAGG